MIHTLGHSNRAAADTVALLQEHAIGLLVDVRSLPRSRHNPQYNSEALAQSLAAAGIGYRHLRALGGMRKPRKDSVNVGFKEDGFRGYADYMESADFGQALDELLALAQGQRVAILCAEADPLHCHRSLISDALMVRGVTVRHILSPGKSVEHRLTAFAQVEGTRLSYPFALTDGSPYTVSDPPGKVGRVGAREGSVRVPKTSS